MQGRRRSRGANCGSSPLIRTARRPGIRSLEVVADSEVVGRPDASSSALFRWWWPTRAQPARSRDRRRLVAPAAGDEPVDTGRVLCTSRSQAPARPACAGLDPGACRLPRESWLRVTHRLLARLPTPECNPEAIQAAGILARVDLVYRQFQCKSMQGVTSPGGRSRWRHRHRPAEETSPATAGRSIEVTMNGARHPRGSGAADIDSGGEAMTVAAPVLDAAGAAFFEWECALRPVAQRSRRPRARSWRS